MTFSIIVPVYKVERYIRQCIDSILTQSYSDFELILVDDGSPDKCPKICDEYANKDKRIKVIHQENKGVSAARNAGIKNVSQGKYIIFIDSDDMLYPDALLNVSNDIRRSNFPEIIVCNIVHWDGIREKIIVNNEKYADEQECKTIREINELYAQDFVQLPWRTYQTVYRRDFLEKNHLKFDERIICAEDCDFYLSVIEKANSYFLSNTVIVKYRVNREGSIINSPSFQSVIGQLKIFAEAFKKANIFPNVQLMQEYFANRYANIIILVSMLNSQTERAYCYAFIEENKQIIGYTSNRIKYRFARMIWSIFGFDRGSELLSKINVVIKNR